MDPRWPAAAVGVTVAALIAAPAQAGGGSGALGGVSVSYAVDDVARFDGPGCARVGWSVDYQRPVDYDLYVELELRQAGSNSPLTDVVTPMYEDPDAATLRGALCIDDDFDPTGGDFTATSTLTVEDENLVEVGSVQLSGRSTVSVVQNRSKFVRLKVRAGTRYVKPPTVRGKVTASTVSKGELGADGSVLVEVRVKGRWRTIDTLSIDQFGRFSATMSKRISKGTKVRAQLAGCGWCTDVLKAVKAK